MYLFGYAAGYYMARGEVDLVITGADRITSEGYVANKIGTYEKAVVARYNKIPFHVATPMTSFDPTIRTGDGIPIGMREGREITDRGSENCAGRVGGAEPGLRRDVAGVVHGVRDGGGGDGGGEDW